MALRVEDIDLAADRELVERWQAGEHAAFDDLYRRYFTRLRSYCQRRVGDRDTAEEIAQEAFVKALQALPRFAGERRFYPWVTVIANRLCVDHHRRLGRVRPTDEIDAGVVDGDHGERLAFLADVDNLDRALQRLGPRHAEVLDLRERKGMSYAQIADHLAVPQSTVEALLFRARKALRREFFAVSGEGKLASLPIVALIARLGHRLGGARARLGEALPSLAQLTGPLAAGAVAVAMSAGPLWQSDDGGPSNGNGPNAVHSVSTAIRESAAPQAPADVVTDTDATSPSGRSGGASRDGIALGNTPPDEAARSANEMPVSASAGPVTIGVVPDALVNEWVLEIVDILEDEE